MIGKQNICMSLNLYLFIGSQNKVSHRGLKVSK